MSDFKRNILVPLLFPVSAFIFIGGIAWGLSRILLGTTTNGAAVVGMVSATAILVACAAIAAHGFRRPEKIVSIFSYVAIVAGGSVFAATAGIRPFESHLPEPSATVVALSAAKFEQTTLQVPAEPVVVVRFDNRDAAAPHNWQVNASADVGAATIVDGGAPFSGPSVRDYALNGVKEGAYYYFCAVHPATMTGTITVGEGGPAPTATTKPSSTATTKPSSTASTKPTTTSPGTGPTSLTLATGPNLTFDQPALTLAAGRKVTLLFQNNDAGIPHNVAISSSEAFEEASITFRGPELFQGIDKRKYAFDAPAAGKYFFRCDVHPTTMKGTITFQ